MNLKYLFLTGLIALGATSESFANEVLLTTNKPAQVTYQIAHKMRGGQTILGDRQTVAIESNLPLSIPLNNYDLTGVVINNVNGHELPTKATKFDEPEQCTMATSKEKPTGALSFTIDTHTLKCQTFGGIYG